MERWLNEVFGNLPQFYLSVIDSVNFNVNSFSLPVFISKSTLKVIFLFGVLVYFHLFERQRKKSSLLFFRWGLAWPSPWDGHRSLPSTSVLDTYQLKKIKRKMENLLKLLTFSSVLYELLFLLFVMIFMTILIQSTKSQTFGKADLNPYFSCLCWNLLLVWMRLNRADDMDDIYGVPVPRAHEFSVQTRVNYSVEVKWGRLGFTPRKGSRGILFEKAGLLLVRKG